MLADELAADRREDCRGNAPPVNCDAASIRWSVRQLANPSCLHDTSSPGRHLRMEYTRMPPAVSARLRVVVAAAIAVAPVPTAAQARVDLTYLANMGVLLESGGRRVIIDGFHRGELAEYAPVPAAMLESLEQARAPFRTLDLMIATHRHRDHFNAASVAARLRADSSVVFLAARETVDSLVARTDGLANHPRVWAAQTSASTGHHLSIAGVDVTVLDLPHNPTPSQRVANVGVIVELGGLRVLHVGDAFAAPTTFARHQLASRPVDVAIVPFWYFANENAEVLRLIGARRWIATHVPPADTAAVRKRVHAADATAIVLTTSGERVSLP